MTVNLSLLGGAGWQFLDNNRSPLSGGLLYTYQAGTTTPQATYTSNTGVTANTNPVVLDSAGRVQSEIWLTQGQDYKFILKTSAGASIGTYDNVPGANDPTDIYAALAASFGSSLIGYLPAGTGAVATTVQTKLRESVSVMDFGAVGNGTTDDTAAINTGISVAVVLKQPLFFPAGTYLVTSSINIPIGTQLLGVKGDQYPAGFGISPLATTINFQPTSANTDLFVASGTSYAGFRFQYSIDGFYFTSNTNARYGLNLNGVIYSRFENLAFETTFQTAIYCNATINNRFVNLFTAGTTTAVTYAGNVETTDVWEQCSFSGVSPIGVDFLGTSIGVRFSNCLFEQLNTYGIRLAKECQNITVENSYGEDVPYANVSTNAMFKIGYTGTALSENAQLTIIGGVFAGRNAGSVGSFVDCDYCKGVQLIGVTHNRFTNIIKTTANTTAQSIRVQGGNGISWVTYANDFTRISGSYPNNVNNTATPSLESRQLNINTNVITAADNGNSLVFLSGGAIQFEPGAGNHVSPTSNGVVNLGLSGQKWATVYAATGAINTSDERQKQQIKTIDDSVLKAWAKVDYCQFKFNDAVVIKSDGARWHFGVIAQQVKVAFESEGLDPFAYGVLCYDEWDNTFDADEKLMIAAGDSYGIRYEEALVLECAYLRSKLK